MKVLQSVLEASRALGAVESVLSSDAIRKKHLCFFRKKHVFFRIKNLASKKTLKKCFFLFFSKYSFKRNYKLTVA